MSNFKIKKELTLTQTKQLKQLIDTNQVSSIKETNPEAYRIALQVKDYLEMLQEQGNQYTISKFSPFSLMTFINKCINLKANPFNQDIYAIPFGNSIVAHTSIDFMRSKARTLGLVGCEFNYGEDKFGDYVECILKKHNKKINYVETYKNRTYFKDYNPTGKNFQDKKFMIEKFSEARALRLAFDILDRLYIEGEIPKNEKDIKIADIQESRTIE